MTSDPQGLLAEKVLINESGYKDLLNASCAGGRKRIFIGLFSASCLVICVFVLLLLVLPWFGISQNYLRDTSIVVGSVLIFFLAWLGISLVFHIYTKKNFPGIRAIRHVVIGLMLPLMEFLGDKCGIKKEIVRRSFIKVNNEFVLNNCGDINLEKTLLLLPHCIQSSACPRRLTYSIENCKNCGNCQIGELIQLSKKYGFHIAVATGGTIARRIVVECRPSFIIAVACERDLTSGIQDTFPIPVFGILNRRPKGPCIDTVAPLDILQSALDYIQNRSEPGKCHCSQ